jgi:hypothetical protein
VNGDRGGFHALPRHELARHVVDDLVGVDVGVVVGRRDGLRVVVEEPRHERAQHEAGAVERLVHGWRLVDTAGDWLEVVDVERERPQVAVPADDVERMMAVDVPADEPARLHAHLELALFVVGHELLGSS